VPSPLSLPPSPISPAPRPPVRLLLVAAGLAVLAAVLAPAAALVALVLGVAVLATAAVLGFRARWQAAAPANRAPLPAGRPVSADQDDVTARLRQLHARYVEQVNAALDTGRTDLAAELSDGYTDEALRLITAGKPVPAAPGPLTRPSSTTVLTMPEEAPVRLASTLRDLLRRFDRYTVEVFQPAYPYRRPAPDRTR
jgi:hypothetical protein